MGSSPDAPPQPKDYTKQIRNAQSIETERRNNEITDWNNQVSQFNTGLQDLYSNYENFETQFNSIDPYDIDSLNSLKPQLNDFSRDVRLYDVGDFGTLTSQPSYSSGFSTGFPGGYVEITPSVQMMSPDDSMYDEIKYGMQDMLHSLGQYQLDYNNELRNIGLAETDARSDAFRLGMEIPRLTIADGSALNTLESQAQQGIYNLQNLDTPIQNLDMSRFDDEIANYQSVISQIQDLYGQRDAEQQRIRDFETGLMNSYDDLYGQISGLSIADITSMDDLGRQLHNTQRDATRFNSLLPYNFQDELFDLGSLQNMIDDLKWQRENELDRIDDKEFELGRIASDVSGALVGLDIYDRNQIDSLQALLDDARASSQGFESELPFDFSQFQGSLDTSQQTIDDIMSRRGEALDSIYSDITNTRAGLDDLELYDEAGINSVLDALRSSRGELNQFYGGRATDIRGTYDQAVGDVNAKLEQLYAKRTEIEQQMQAALEQFNNQDFYSLSDLDPAFAQAEQFKQQQQLYNAKAALDELDAIMGRLNGEKQRLEADAEAVRLRENRASQDIQSKLVNGNLQFDDPDIISFLFQQQKDKEEQLASSGGFSSLV